MKHFHYLALSLATAFSANAESLTVNVNDPGTLPEIIDESKKYEITDLTVTGPLNGTDILYIREMAGADVLGNPTDGQLAVADLSGSTIKEGGECYFADMTDGYCYTSDNAIGAHMFDKCGSLSKLILPASTAEVASTAFNNCMRLSQIDITGSTLFTSVDGVLYDATMLRIYRYPEGKGGSTYTLPESVQYINNHAFFNCWRLSSAGIPDRLHEIGDYAFAECYFLTTINYPPALNIIGKCAFLNCTMLESGDLPDSVTEIGEYAFFSCSAITSLNIPRGLTVISPYTFAYCSGIAGINIPEGVTIIEDNAFDSCSAATSLSLPSTIEYIGHSGFFSCSAVESLTLPESIEYIGPYAFAYLDLITEISVPEKVSELYTMAFGNCTSLRKVHLPSRLTYIPDNLFNCCENLTDVNIPAGVTEIQAGAFGSCSSLTTLTLPQDLRIIDDCAFISCTSLQSIILPESLEELGDMAFIFCENLTGLNIPRNLKYIGEYALFDTRTTHVELPATIGYLGRGALSNLALVPEVGFESGFQLSAFPPECFRNDTMLTAISIPEPTESIGDDIFKGCTSLTSVTLPSTLSNLGNNILIDCPALERIISLAETPGQCGVTTFEGCDTQNVILEVPAGCAELYRNAAGWREFAHISDTADIDNINADVPAENTYYSVFSLSGIQLLDKAPKESLVNLPAGYYIINGKCTYFNPAR